MSWNLLCELDIFHNHMEFGGLGHKSGTGAVQASRTSGGTVLQAVIHYATAR